MRRECVTCGRPASAGFTTQDGDGPWCAPACLPWWIVQAQLAALAEDADDPFVFWTTWDAEASDATA